MLLAGRTVGASQMTFSVLSLTLFLKNRTVFVLLLNIIAALFFNVQNNSNVFHSPLPVYIVSNP